MRRTATDDTPDRSQRIRVNALRVTDQNFDLPSRDLARAQDRFDDPGEGQCARLIRRNHQNEWP